MGIATLNPRLSDILLEKIKNELPNMMDELVGKIAECKSEIEKLGDARETLVAQSRYLSSASFAFHSIIKVAVDGTYNSPFVEDSMTGPMYDKRLRDIIETAKRNLQKP